MSQADPRICSYKLSGDIRKKVDILTNSKDVEPAVKTRLKTIMEEDESNKNTLTYESLAALHKYIQWADPDDLQPFYLFKEACKCVAPKSRDNKQLNDRLNNLRLRESQKIYNCMTASVDRAVEDKMERLADSGNNSSSSQVYSNLNNKDSQTHLSEFKRLNGSLVALFNSFLVFICTFIFCFKALEYALPRPNIIAQVLFGLGGSTVVAIAELYFLLRVI